VIRFILRRLAHALLVLWGVSLLTFALIKLAPGDYFAEMRMNPQISPGTLEALRSAYGLDRSLPVTYLRWVRAVGRGDLGFSFAYNSPVWPLLKVRAANTLLLSLTALALAWLAAIPLGIWSAARPGHWEDKATSVGTTILLAVPDVLIALGLLALALKTGWFPTGGMHSLAWEEMGVAAKARDLAAHLALPVMALVAGLLPMLIRHVRSAMLDVLDSPYLQAARGHGIPRGRLLYRHALRAAANPLISLFGVSLGTLLSGSLLIEVIMSWPGLGPMLLQAILERDLYVVVAAVLFSTVFLVAGNLLADVLLHLADPRIRAE
jgi:peptide/nickel transport system permease protein